VPTPGSTPRSAAPDPVEDHLASIRVGQLESYLARTDAACPACGYDLRGHRGGTCPECGRRLGVLPVRATARAATLVPLGLGSGLNGAAVVAALVFLVIDHTTRHGALRVLATAGPFFGIHTFLLARGLGRGQGRTRAVRIGAAIGAWVLLAAGVAVFRIVNI
jgi:hypothetical protein